MTNSNYGSLPATLPDRVEMFRSQAKKLGMNPDDRWVGGYAAYEMDHLLPSLLAYGIDVNGKNVLEFGCNVGASSVVLQVHGAHVTGVDIEKDIVTLAELNSRQYGLDEGKFHCVEDTRKLPFPDGHFDLVVCNSVLEYVPHTIIADVQRELTRVTKAQGIIFVTGTSSRIAPKETHSGRWFVNYLPRALDRVFGKPEGFQRGISPFQIRNGFGSDFINIDSLDGGEAFLRARSGSGTGRKSALQLFVKVARLLGVGPGLLLPNISCVLKKR